MHLPDNILGKGTVATLQERVKAPVLTIGNDKFSRKELASINCFNFTAAAMLSNIVTHQLKVRDTADLFKRIPPAHLALPGLGSISLATLGAAFESKLGRTLSDYIDHHRGENEHIVTFTTIKAHEADSKAEREAKKEEKKRKRRRLAQAHEIRVERFVTKQAKTPTVQNGVTK